jgi:hypothetical protein
MTGPPNAREPGPKPRFPESFITTTLTSGHSDSTAPVKVRGDAQRAYDEGRSYCWWSLQYARAGLCPYPTTGRTAPRIEELHYLRYCDLYGPVHSGSDAA